MTFRKLLSTAAAFGILFCASAHADILSLTYQLSTLVAQPGDTIIARGTVTNLENVVVDLNGCSLTLAGPFATDGCAIFFDLSVGAPLSLGVGESATFDLFTYTVDPLFAGPYGLQPPGTFTIQGALEPDPGGGTLNTLLESPFQVDVVPEPGSATLLVLTLPIAFALRRRKRA